MFLPIHQIISHKKDSRPSSALSAISCRVNTTVGTLECSCLLVKICRFWVLGHIQCACLLRRASDHASLKPSAPFRGGYAKTPKNEREWPLRRTFSPKWSMARKASWDSHISPYHLKYSFSYEKCISTSIYQGKGHFFKVALSEIDPTKMPILFLLMLLKTRKLDFC